MNSAGPLHVMEIAMTDPQTPAGLPDIQSIVTKNWKLFLAEGIVHVRQPDSAVAAARAALPTDPWSIAALHVVTTLTGSALLALALLRGMLDPDQVWTAAHVDECDLPRAGLKNT